VHLRALATTATTSAVKNRLLDEADQHEKLAEFAGEALEELAGSPLDRVYTGVLGVDPFGDA
jgi:hypothetical protein